MGVTCSTHVCKVFSTEKGMLGDLREFGEGTVKQDEDPTVTEDDAQGRGLREPGGVAIIQPQWSHGKLLFLPVTHGTCRETSSSRPQKSYPTLTHRPLVRASPDHMPCAISYNSTFSLHQLHSRIVCPQARCSGFLRGPQRNLA